MQHFRWRWCHGGLIVGVVLPVWCVTLYLPPLSEHVAVRAAPLPGRHVPWVAVDGVPGGAGGVNAMVGDHLRLGFTRTRSQSAGCLLPPVLKRLI